MVSGSVPALIDRKSILNIVSEVQKHAAWNRLKLAIAYTDSFVFYCYENQDYPHTLSLQKRSI